VLLEAIRRFPFDAALCAVLDDGTRVHLDHFLGFAEKVFNEW
jgi:hypothetical protein